MITKYTNQFVQVPGGERIPEASKPGRDAVAVCSLKSLIGAGVGGINRELRAGRFIRGTGRSMCDVGCWRAGVRRPPFLAAVIGVARDARCAGLGVTMWVVALSARSPPLAW